MEKLGWRDRRISPDSGSLFQTFLREKCKASIRGSYTPFHVKLILTKAIFLQTFLSKLDMTFVTLDSI